MADNDQNESPVEKAVRKRKELQERLKNTIQEIEAIEIFLKTYRDFTAGTPKSEKGDNHEISQATWGSAQQAFEVLVVGVLRDVGRPMRSGELIEEFRKRGHAIRGNEVRTAWNRLWNARKGGVLTSDRTLGYWIVGEPLSDDARAAAALVGRRGGRAPVGSTLRNQNKGKKKGRAPILTPEQVEAGEKMFLAGKSRAEVAAALGGVSQGTIKEYFGGIKGVQKKYPDAVIPKRPSRPYHGNPGTGRPPMLSDLEGQRIVKMRAEGKSIEEIMDYMQIKRGAVYRYLKKFKGAK
jgi:hypothetical protein